MTWYTIPLAAMSAVAIFSLGISPSKATIVYDTPLASPGVYFGSGNANQNFTVDSENGIELGLSAIIRYVGPVAPSPTNSDIYVVPDGPTHVAGKSGSAWGFDFSINLRPGGVGTLTLADVTATLTMTDALKGTTGSFSPFLIPDNTEYGSSGKVVCSTPSPCSSGDWALQNSEALSFASISALGFNDPGYDLNSADTYTFTLAVHQGTNLLATDTIVVDAVPEPASLSLFGAALIGFGAWRRWRKKAA